MNFVIILPTNLEMICVFTNLANISSETDKIYPSKSASIEILNSNKTNVIVGCIYRHSHMDLNEFNDCYVNNLLDK